MSLTNGQVTLVTASQPGAVALIQLAGVGATDALRRLTRRDDWHESVVRLVNFADVDQGLAVRWREDWVQLMPHGGPRVVEKIIEILLEYGAVYKTTPAARDVYPEAQSDLEADMLATVAKAASPRAVDLLLQQPRMWSDLANQLSQSSAVFVEIARQQILARSDSFDKLIAPPTVVVVGRPNVGKSTLTNRLLGRSASVVTDLPGTTRDWVAGLAQIDGVAVRWLDTPGLRESDDPIETRAIELAREAIARADVLIVMREPAIDWPAIDVLPREPDVWVMNKIDDVVETGMGRGASRDEPVTISARDGGGLNALRDAVLHCLKLADSHAPAAWAFSPALRRHVQSGDAAALLSYLAKLPTR